MTETLLRPAVFLDRDGTLNTDRHFVHKPEDMELIAGAAKTVRNFKDSGYWVVIVTNQSGIARGYFDVPALDEFHRTLSVALAAEGAKIDLILHCPHHPDFTGPCDCRKPKPGMIAEAARRLPIDLTRSILIGDRPSDMQCAEAANIDGYLFTGGNLLRACKDWGLIR